MNGNNFELAHQVAQAIMDTDEWERIWTEYPGVVEARTKLDTVMEQVSARIPGELLDDLWDAMRELNWADECASMLYGVRLARSVSGAMAAPRAFSRYAAGRKAEVRCGQAD